VSDYYQILQVDPSADPEIIEAAYKRLVRKYHPDVNASPDATARMQEINEAYAVLNDPAQRAAYDYERNMGATYFPMPPPPPRRRSLWERLSWLVLGVVGLIFIGACVFISGVAYWMLGQPKPTPTSVQISRPFPTLIPPTPTRTPEPPTITPTPPRPTRTPTPIPFGYTRAYPIPLGDSVVWTGRDREQVRFTIFEFYRGEEAWRRLVNSNRVTSPPPPLFEYALFRVHAEVVRPNRTGVTISPDMSFRVIGSDTLEYAASDMPSLSPPEPRLPREIPPGDGTDGWLVFAVPVNDQNLILTYGQTLFVNEMRVWLSTR
jgi:hypothetical protein